MIFRATLAGVAAGQSASWPSQTTWEGVLDSSGKSDERRRTRQAVRAEVAAAAAASAVEKGLHGANLNRRQRVLLCSRAGIFQFALIWERANLY
jgi:hypothetical protein